MMMRIPKAALRSKDSVRDLFKVKKGAEFPWREAADDIEAALSEILFDYYEPDRDAGSKYVDDVKWSLKGTNEAIAELRKNVPDIIAILAARASYDAEGKCKPSAVRLLPWTVNNDKFSTLCQLLDQLSEIVEGGYSGPAFPVAGDNIDALARLYRILDQIHRKHMPGKPAKTIEFVWNVAVASDMTDVSLKRFRNIMSEKFPKDARKG